MFVLKKIVTQLLLPLNFCLFFLITGLILILFSKRQRLGKIVLSAGMLFLLVFSFPPFSGFLIGKLESQYPPLADNFTEHSSVRWIVVLGGGHNSSRQHSAQLSPSSLARLTEAIRIYKEVPGIKMVLSGGSVFDPIPNSEAMAGTATMLGVPQDDLILEKDSRDTEEEAKILSSTIKGETFYLVTSASHMPRSIALFRGQKMHPIPAPTDYSFQSQNVPVLLRYLPNLSSLSQSERAIREFMGIAWSKLREKA